MDTNVMFSANQINIPPELAPVLKQYTKAVLGNEESITRMGLYKWTANYFADLGGMAPLFEDTGHLVGANVQMVSDVVSGAEKFEDVPWRDDKEDKDSMLSAVFGRLANADGLVATSDLPLLIDDVQKATGVHLSHEDVVQAVGNREALMCEDFKALFLNMSE
ncbi:cAMP-dependent protein kinase dimerization/docking domain [Diplonema papillatum]|nr:cAMP-dependent protein kinase dimerization/docking domain [Diplonema papillatum]